MSSWPEPASGERLRGLIERVIFHNPENGYAVLKARVPGMRGLVSVTGSLPSVHPGEMLEAEGSWKINPRHGRQFQAEVLRAVPPGTAEGMRKYLGSGLIRGIGPAMASRLVAAFGDGVFQVIENRPEELTRVEGIGPARRDLIVRAWGEQARIRDIMVFLHGHGVSTGRAFRIYRTYGDRAVELIRADPYRLARDIPGIGFLSADRIASSLLIAPDSVLRGSAGLDHVLRRKTEQGHCAADRDELLRETAELLGTSPDSAAGALDRELRAGRLLVRAADEGGELVFPAGLDAAELGVARRFRDLCAGVPPLPGVNSERAAAWAESRLGVALSLEQKEALRLALATPVAVITGGPGVGKTTLIAALVLIFQAKGRKVALAAPTGRAARRMSESAGIPASTIHRLLEFDPRRGSFTRDRDRPLSADVLIVDEFSMVDLPLAWSLLEAVGGRTALIAVGDVDQLPSVGPGRVLQDLIDSGSVPVARLKTIFRQAEAGRIVLNAHRVNAGRLPLEPPGGEESDYYFIECEDPARGVETICDLAARRIPRLLQLDPVEDIQVLAPMRRGELGVTNLNARLQAVLNPGEGGVEFAGGSFRAGDRVMQTVNDYEKDVFNGDIGKVALVDEEAGEVVVRFEGKEVSYSRADLDDICLAYAVSIHKSQGSEYPAVIVPLHTQHYMLLKRNLLYTAITRGKRLVVIVGSRRALGLAVSQADTARRVTLLASRLRLTAARAPSGEP